MKPSLAALIGSKSVSNFEYVYRNNEPMVVEGTGKNISELTQTPFLISLDSLLEAWPSEIDVYRDGVADEANSTQVDRDEARRRFKKGRGLLFNDVNRFSAPIQEWVEAIKRDLRVSKMTIARSLIYATPAGHGTDPHFDQNINFVMQVHGKKKWWIVPNTHVENPLCRHTIGLSTDPELSTYIDEPLPQEFPKGATEYTLNPGSLLFLPRGAWHKTEAVTDALSLNFTYSAPTWLDLFTAALRSRLALSKEWRETADPELAEKFDVLIAGLVDDAQDWRAKDILGVTE